MTVIAKHQGLSTDVPDRLSDEQRAKIHAFFAAARDGADGAGYKAACRAAGLRLRHDDAKRLIMADDELREAYFATYKLDEPSLFRTLGDIAANGDHKDQFRAVTFGLNALYRWHENASVEHSGAMEVTNPDVSAAIERFTGTVARLAARNGAGPAVGELDPGREG